MVAHTHLVCLLSVSLAIIVGCSSSTIEPTPEEETPQESKNCWEVSSLSPNHTAWVGSYPPVRYDLGDTNPANEQEYLFYRKQISGGEHSMYVGNWASGTERLLAEGAGEASWGQNGWVIFRSLQDFQLYKMRSDGTGLTQLTFSGRNMYPAWRPNKNEFVFVKQSWDYREVQWVIANEDGKVLDTLFSNPEIRPKWETHWSPDGSKLGFLHTSAETQLDALAYLTYPEKVYHPVFSNDTWGDTETISSFDWSMENDLVYWSNGLGILSINTGTKEVVELVPDCENHYYTKVVSSSKSGYLFAEANDVSILPPDTLFQEIQIESIDLVEQEIQWLNQ